MTNLESFDTMTGTENLDATAFTETNTLRESVDLAMKKYFSSLEGQQPTDLYNMVLAEIEAPLLERVMEQTRGNQTKAAVMLGLNRGTLRKKLKMYGLN